MDAGNPNYNPLATEDDGSCLCDNPGCMDPLAINYDPNACLPGDCIYVQSVPGCTDPTAQNYDPLATVDDGSCIASIYGCTDPLATNYYAGASIDDGSCTYGPAPIAGCTDPTATNYNPAATIDDGSCILCVYGCTDSTALNYDPNATCDDGSCTYTLPIYNVFRFLQQAVEVPGSPGGTAHPYVTLLCMKQISWQWDPITSIQDLTPGYSAVNGSPVAGSNNSSQGTLIHRRWLKSFWPGGIATVVIRVNYASGTNKVLTMSCSTEGVYALTNNNPIQPNGMAAPGADVPVGCYQLPSNLSHSGGSGGVRTLLNPGYPVGVIHKAEVISDPAAILVSGEEAYNHISLASFISNASTYSICPIWDLSSEWGDGFKPSSNSNQEQVIKIHSAVTELDTVLKYKATNGIYYDSVQDITTAFSIPQSTYGNSAYSQVYSTASGGTQAFGSIGDLYATHNNLGEDSYFYETIVYANKLTPC
tara:strand:- start:778 stop:2208 length:1431 start_codon:yes stop_codon:yes gene_type:complete